MQHFFFNGWQGPLRTLLIGGLAYVLLIIVLRVSGKRTLSKMNAFDLVVTVALGSSFGAILLNKDVALLQGFVAFALLAGMQFVLTWCSVRSERIRRLVKSEPRLLVHRGEPLLDAMRKERVTQEEIVAAARDAQVESLGQIESAVLESDGTLSIIPRQQQNAR